MTILKRSKGSFALESLQQSQQKYVTTEFGTTVRENGDELNVENNNENVVNVENNNKNKVNVDNDDNKVNVDDDERDAGGEDSDVYVSILGNFGKYQLRNVLLMGLTGLTFSWSNFGTKFVTEETEFWCAKVE
jgi:hypothetical protein